MESTDHETPELEHNDEQNPMDGLCPGLTRTIGNLERVQLSGSSHGGQTTLGDGPGKEVDSGGGARDAPRTHLGSMVCAREPEARRRPPRTFLRLTPGSPSLASGDVLRDKRTPCE